MTLVWDILSLVLIGMVTAIVVFCLYIIAIGIYYQAILGPFLERELGFVEGAAYIKVGQRLHSAVALCSIVPGGVFDRAGFQVGDVLPGLSHIDLFRLLNRSRRRIVQLTVADGSQGLPFGMRPIHLIRFEVPLRTG